MALIGFAAAAVQGRFAQDTILLVTGVATFTIDRALILDRRPGQPVGRIQRTIDRHFRRARYDAQWTAAAFSERLHDEVDLASVTADVSQTIRIALAITALGVWLRRGDVGR
jgi:hypothetical protein